MQEQHKRALSALNCNSFFWENVHIPPKQRSIQGDARCTEAIVARVAHTSPINAENNVSIHILILKRGLSRAVTALYGGR